jgi:hypothetical protein
VSLTFLFLYSVFTTWLNNLGGISFYSGRSGWCCDSVISYEIVLPSGQVINVDMKSHPDLFWALRGAGSSNFGIVTSFVLVAIELPNPRGLWAGVKAYSQEKVPQLLDDMHGFWTQSQAEDENIAGINFYKYTAEQNNFTLATLRYHATHDDPESWPQSISQHHITKSIPGTSKSFITQIAPYCTSLAQGFQGGRRNVWLTLTYRPSREFERHLYAIFEEEAVKLKDVEGFHVGISTQLAPRSVRIAPANKGGGNCLGLSGETEPLVILVYSWSYIRPTDHQIVEETAHRCADRIEAKAKDFGVWHPFRYMNYADEKFQAKQVWDGYGHENITRLRRIQREVDPTGVFTNGGLASGYFKLNKL